MESEREQTYLSLLILSCNLSFYYWKEIGAAKNPTLLFAAFSLVPPWMFKQVKYVKSHRLMTIKRLMKCLYETWDN
ncbi:unnamed protein product [Coffea canephora]|uniref:Uncharacterized protein n=1 Tax=Coffea canephora TaxID=49390 RepID=A0A068TTF1_COFCA|nr:unnamed protein product [Coffea canephora]